MTIADQQQKYVPSKALATCFLATSSPLTKRTSFARGRGRLDHDCARTRQGSESSLPRRRIPAAPVQEVMVTCGSLHRRFCTYPTPGREELSSRCEGITKETGSLIMLLLRCHHHRNNRLSVAQWKDHLFHRALCCHRTRRT